MINTENSDSPAPTGFCQGHGLGAKCTELGGDFASLGPPAQISFHLRICKISEFKRWGCTVTATAEPQVIADLGSLCAAPQQYKAMVRGCFCHRALDILTHPFGLPHTPPPHRNLSPSPSIKRLRISSMEFKVELWSASGGADRMILASMSHASQGYLWAVRKE